MTEGTLTLLHLAQDDNSCMHLLELCYEVASADHPQLPAVPGLNLFCTLHGHEWVGKVLAV